jgi:hypothetical protein
MIETMKSFAVAFGTTVRQLQQQQQIPSGMTTRNTTATAAAKAMERRWDYSTVFIRVPMPSMVI